MESTSEQYLSINKSSDSSKTNSQDKNNDNNYEHTINNINDDTIHNTIACRVAGIKTNSIPISIIADSGNNLPFPAISFRLYTTLWNANIAHNHPPPLKSSLVKASAANGKSIKIVGELEQTRKFSIIGCTIFQLKSFLSSEILSRT